MEQNSIKNIISIYYLLFAKDYKRKQIRKEKTQEVKHLKVLLMTVFSLGLLTLALQKGNAQVPYKANKELADPALKPYEKVDIKYSIDSAKFSEYETKPYKHYGKDNIRYTQKGNQIYAFCQLEGETEIILPYLKEKPKQITQLGYKGDIDYSISEGELRVRVENKTRNKKVIALKVEL